MLDGIINVYKEPGFTSHDVVAKLRGILRQKKIGHTGTLDPAATGVLPVCLGCGTKLCDMLTDRDKVYEAEMILGLTSDTLDTSGQILSQMPVYLSDCADDNGIQTLEAGTMTFTSEEIQNAIASFIGEYDQIPPMYSALKVNGKKLYELARAGVEVERKPRRICIYDIQVLSIQVVTLGQIQVRMTVSCQKGTYIRSLCDDIGAKLGCGAVMGQLIRTRSAGFSIEEALTLSDIERLREAGELEPHIYPVERAFADCPKIVTKPSESRYLYNGNPLMMDQLAVIDENDGKLLDECRVRVYDDKGQFLAVYIYNEPKQMFKTYKMFAAQA